MELTIDPARRFAGLPDLWEKKCASSTVTVADEDVFTQVRTPE
jgi:hypothetical protein